MVDAYTLGMQHRSAGKSIYYNPFRHKGTAQQYLDWKAGWLAANGTNK